MSDSERARACGGRRDESNEECDTRKLERFPGRSPAMRSIRYRAAGEAPPGLERALGRYPILANPVVTPLSGGLIHASFAVSDDGSEYVLQRKNAAFAAGVERNIEQVTQLLAERGLQTLKLMRTADGALCADLGEDGCWRLMTRVAGVCFEHCESPAQARSAAALLARFHSALTGWSEPLQPLGFPFHDMARHLVDLKAALRSHADHPLHEGVSRLAEEILAAHDALGEPARVVTRVVHGDPKFSNLLFAGTRGEERRTAVAWIDLDTLSRLPLYVDFGDALRSWCNVRGENDAGVDIDETRLQAAVESYLEALEFQLELDERRSLVPALERISLELSVRFATDALEERHWLWDHERFESAGEHNLLRARGQLALHERARGLRTTLERLIHS